MSDLDPNAMSIYYQRDDLTAAKVTELSGIGDLFPGAHIDDFLFNPCGYSMNGVLGDGYFTIHITPQPEYSYVSFETDIPLVRAGAGAGHNGMNKGSRLGGVFLSSDLALL